MKAHPFLKWVGGKTQLLPELGRRLPPRFGCYWEPFVGGGALFFAMAPSSAVISDSNEELINCYRIIHDCPAMLCAELRQSGYVYDEGRYYEIRAMRPNDLEPIKRAARMIYLNRCGFNGLYRVNQKGEFNVPFGRYTNPLICDEKNIHACASALRLTDIRAGGFGLSLEATEGDLVYFDPPYVPLNPTSNFTHYAIDRFGENQQRELADTFRTLASKGVLVLLSNSDTPLVRELYRDYCIERVEVRRNVNSKGDKRGPVGEVIVTGWKRPAKATRRMASEERIG